MPPTTSDMTHDAPHAATPARRRAQNAWCLYDWANSAFATSVVSAILPVYFASVASKSMAKHEATALWGYASAAALALTAVLSPIAGALADQTRRRKPILLACVLAGVAGTLTLAAAPTDAWWSLLAAFGVAFVAFATGNVLYDSLLPAVAGEHEMDAISSRGFAWGYLGGGLLLAVHLALVLMPKKFGLPDAGAATRVAFASVAVWWLAFSLPLFRDVPEPQAAAERVPVGALLRNTIAQLLRTTAHLRERRDLFTFLVAFWLYSDGIGTIIKMATIYGAEVGIGQKDLIGALLMVQILAAPAALLFGRLAKPLGPKRAVMIGIAGYTGISVFAYFLATPLHFWILAAMVAMFQGGTQALSRSMFASLVPREQTGELFGFYSVSEKLAGVVGPILFGVVTQLSGGGRLATLTLLPLVLGGAWMLSRVDLARGKREAGGAA
ncbi:MAG: MFS transporter [Candidatus Eisenbacteria bacterium]|uniref:MFS transporter n=1 Tax=Eiseniibacteriota bacterium TaxID=2212470 RepID=A0A933W9C8_UNCEI|nr:MFS transporter [Candidatus Eisenbacteria bacterium]